MHLLDIITILCIGLMVGNELTVSLFINPVIWQLDEPAQAKAFSLFARYLGKAMPIWYGLSLVLILGALFEHRPVSSGPGLFLALAAALWLAAILFSVTMLVPINNRIAKLDPAHPYDCWLQDRCRWDQLHQLRVVLLIMAFVLLLTDRKSTRLNSSHI